MLSRSAYTLVIGGRRVAAPVMGKKSPPVPPSAAGLFIYEQAMRRTLA